MSPAHRRPRIRPPLAPEIVDLASRDSLDVSLAEAEELEPAVSSLLETIDELLALPGLTPPAPRISANT